MCFLPSIKPSRIYFCGSFYFLVSGFKGDLSAPQPAGGTTPDLCRSRPHGGRSDSQAVHVCDEWVSTPLKACLLRADTFSSSVAPYNVDGGWT